MKKHLRAFLCLVMCLLLSAAVFTGCGDGSSSAAGPEDEDGAALTLNGEAADQDLIAYLGYALSLQALSSNQSFFDSSENTASLKSAVIEQVKNYLLPTFMAKENNISLSPEEEAEVAEQVKQLIASVGGEDAYDEALAQMHMTRALQEDVIRTQLLQNKMLKEVYGESLKNEIYRAKHILIKYDAIPSDDDGNPTMTEEEWRADRLKLAEELSKRAKDGENFDDLIKEYNEDGGMASNPDGYYFIEGQMQQAFFEGTKALEIGGVSEPVEVNDYYKGFHIIQRLEPDADVVDGKLAELAASSEKAQSDADVLYNAIDVKEGAQLDSLLQQQIDAAKTYVNSLQASSSSAASSASSDSPDSASGSSDASSSAA
ncbi:MAG: peptidylprolyl isomerase [Oscillospiraceae bacterium]|nr:peptidylprolyl isomerase [Oscillospiraceae bacterium]